MDSVDLLVLGAEVAVSIAGFSGIIATFQFGRENTARRGDAVALTMVVQFSFLAAAACAIALILNSIGVTQEFLWAVSSVAVSVFYVVMMYAVAKGMRGATTKTSVWIFVAILQLFAAVAVVTNALNAIDYIFHRGPGPFFYGVGYAIGLAGYMFSRLLLRPIWRAVRKQEAIALAVKVDNKEPTNT